MPFWWMVRVIDVGAWSMTLEPTVYSGQKGEARIRTFAA